MVGPFLAPCLRIWLFSGQDLAPWRKVDMATLPVSVAQKNKPSTMLSSNVLSIDLPMNCMA